MPVARVIRPACQQWAIPLYLAPPMWELFAIATAVPGGADRGGFGVLYLC